ncbi:MAG: OmpA family protein [Cytophagaceae bacterium]
MHLNLIHTEKEQNASRYKIIKSFLTLFLSLVFGFAFSQHSIEIEKDISVKKMKDRAVHAIKIGDVYTALFYYEEVVKIQPEDIDAWFQLAEAYRLSRNYTKAEETYARVYEKAPGKYPFSLFYMGQMQKMGGKYEEAKKNLVLFKKESRNLGDKNFAKLLTKEIVGCDSGMVYKEFPDNVLISNAGKSVNYPHVEFSPIFLDSTTMLFGSLRMESLKYFDVSDENREVQPVRQVYKAVKVNGEWKEKGKDEVFNDETMDMGNFAYSPYSGKYFFSKCTKDKKGKVTCKLFVTEKVKGKWSSPEQLPSPVNLDGYTNTQPTIMYDTVSKKEFLYFVSDRPGGKGGLDIWYTSFVPKKKEWAEPKNAGGMNTPETECTPFFHIPTQTLYFSSNGHPSSGGLDVFKVWKQDDGRYVKPQNLSFPINSPQDDLDFTLSEDGKKGFVVSNRPGGTPYFHETCCDDIFGFEILPPKPFLCTLDLSVVNPDSADCAGQLLNIKVYDHKTKKESFDTVRLTDCKHLLPLEKNQRYSFYIDKDGFQKDTLVVETRDMASAEILKKNLVLKPIEKPAPEIISEVPTEGKAFVLKDIQYETNADELSDEAKAALDSILIPFLKKHPDDKVYISSHTDDAGSHKYNMNLSQRRAQNVVKYLISKGVDSHRLHSKGFGETKPIAPNTNPDGSPNIFGRSINRRTEFLLVKPHEKHPHY